MAKRIKFAVCALICMLCASVNVNAQEFFQVEGVEKIDKVFFVLAGEKKVKVNPLIYKLVKKSPKKYVIAYMEGEKENFLTVADKSACRRLVLEVDSVGLNENEQPRVFFMGGNTYDDPDEGLLKLRRGQKLEVTAVTGLTQNFFRHRTVPRETPCGEKTAADAQDIAAVSQSTPSGE